MEALPFLLFGGGLVVVLLLGYLSYRSAKKRWETLSALAAQRGWTYADQDDRWIDRFTGEPFGQGHDRQALNVLSGRYDGRVFVAFDYRYSTTESTTDAQENRQSHTEVHPFSVVGIDSGVALPDLAVTPENFLGRFVGRLTGFDIDLESEAFNRAFTVHADDRKFATDVLHPRMMEYLLQVPDRGWTLRGGWLLAVRPGQHSVAEMDTRLSDLDGILDRIPDFVWKQAGLPPQTLPPQAPPGTA